MENYNPKDQQRHELIAGLLNENQILSDPLPTEFLAKNVAIKWSTANRDQVFSIIEDFSDNTFYVERSDAPLIRNFEQVTMQYRNGLPYIL